MSCVQLAMNACQTHESAQLWTALPFMKPKSVPSELTLSLSLFPQTLKDSYHTFQGFSCNGQTTSPFRSPALRPYSQKPHHLVSLLTLPQRPHLRGPNNHRLRGVRPPNEASLNETMAFSWLNKLETIARPSGHSDEDVPPRPVLEEKLSPVFYAMGEVSPALHFGLSPQCCEEA